MKFDVRVQSGSLDAEHVVEVPERARGRGDFKLDGVPLNADWAEVEPGVYSFVVAGKSYIVSAHPKTPAAARDGSYEVWVGGRAFQVQVRDSLAKRHAASDAAHEGPLEILAPMPGRIVKILAQQGAAIAAGDGLLVIEAMKMQNEIRAPRAGTIRKLHVRENDGVEAGARLVSVV